MGLGACHQVSVFVKRAIASIWLNSCWECWRLQHSACRPALRVSTPGIASPTVFLALITCRPSRMSEKGWTQTAAAGPSSIILAPSWCAWANLLEGQRGQRRRTVNGLRPVPQRRTKRGLSFWHGGYISMLRSTCLHGAFMSHCTAVSEVPTHTHTFSVWFMPLSHIPSPHCILLSITSIVTFAFWMESSTSSFTNKPGYRPHSLCHPWHSQPAVTERAESCSHTGQDRGKRWNFG